ncbi:hypothetical protein [Microtetraspora sp. NBRC 16547]|uniref:DUF7674 family protein n=1 Tax=Microtetraspora sp. NBRC 16547 TaxID=3030993 RepID=UPI0024A47DDC|nr:hypothetical protein [Microtetraspora sp. NBRC 16547]GLW96465.1 hypothetical protein Misp02_05520 [Microtetraspora sp. NBRC 16547]
MYEDVVDRFVQEVPEFTPVWQEHVADNGEVLQHVLFWDVTMFVLDAHERGNRKIVDRCLDFLERALQSTDVHVRNLVGTSFVENVGPWDPAVRDFIGTWPPLLREQAARDGWQATEAPNNMR